MEDFAKLFRDEDVGQVLVTINKHVVTIRFTPPGMELCALRSELPDTPEGCKSAAELFSKFDEDFAVDVVSEFLKEQLFEQLKALERGSLDA